MVHDFLHLMAIMIILARIWSIIFAFDGYTDYPGNNI